MSAAEARLEAALQLLLEGEPRALLGAIGGAHAGTSRTTAELWGPLLTKLLGGPDELAAILWSVDIGRRMVDGTPTLAEHTGDLKERLDAAHRFLREVADGAAPEPEPVQLILPPEGEPCSSCGATVAECNKVIAQTVADRSCCALCKSTDTHQLTAAGRRG